jgi:hypothetical protein
MGRVDGEKSVGDENQKPRKMSAEVNLMASEESS